MGTGAMVRRSLVLIMPLFLVSCGDDPLPKPKGWLRLDLPEQAYQPWSPECPYSAELPTYAQAVPRPEEDHSCWVDIDFPGQRAAVHLTYVEVNGNLERLIRDAHDFKDKHEVKAVKISSERVLRDSSRVFGTLFDLEGNVASPMVFYLTDSTSHFLYGALYFNARPNADSLAPVTARIRQDIRRLVNTLEWK